MQIKAARAGLECRTEAELDERIAEHEHSIAHDGLSLRAERQAVQAISRLRGQREKIREFAAQQEGLGQMEAEAKKIKAVIDEVRPGRRAGRQRVSYVVFAPAASASGQPLQAGQR